MLFLRRHWQAMAVCLSVVLVAVLGYSGVNEYFMAQGEQRPIWDVCYYVLCLFVLEVGELEGSVPWQLTAARLLGAGIAFWAVVRTVLMLFDERLRAAKPQFWRDHAVVCGLGRKGLCLALELREKGMRVAAIGREADHPNILRCRKEGVVTFVGDATDPGLLDRAKATRAQYVFMVTGDDGANVDASMKLYAMKKERDRDNNSTACYAHMVDLHLCELFKRHKTFTDASDNLEVHIVNTYESAARLLLLEHPLEGDRPDEKQPHLIVLGFGKMGRTVALQAAKTAHYRSGEKLRITMLDRAATHQRDLFYGDYPRFSEICRAEFMDMDITSAEAINKIDEWARNPSVRPTIVVCLDSDSTSLGAAMKIASRIRGCSVPIYVRMFEDTGLASLITSQDQGCATGWLGCLKPFALFSQTCRFEAIVGNKRDTLARAVHEQYRESADRTARDPNDPALKPWEELDPARRDSNRQFADHIPVKLRAIGCVATDNADKSASIIVFSDDEIETLAKMEHNRYCAERYLAGWTQGERNDERLTTPNLVPWQELPEPAREAARDKIRNLPALLHKVAEKAVRV